MTDDQATDRHQTPPAVEGPLEPTVVQQWWQPHTHGRLVAIEFDGAAVYECAACGKHVERAL